MADEEASKPELNRQAIHLAWPQRTAAAVLSLLLFTIASWSIIKGTDGSAVLAFAVIAGLFGLLAVVGVVPQRIKTGEHVMELYEAIEQRDREIEAAVGVMNVEQLQEAAEQVEPTTLRTNSNVLREAARLESIAMANLQRAAIDLGVEVWRPQHDYGWDAEVQLSNDGRVLVSIKARLSPSALRNLADKLKGREHKVLLISPDTDRKVFERAKSILDHGRRQVVITGTSVEDIRDGLHRLSS